jgi:hypothetical protein
MIKVKGKIVFNPDDITRKHKGQSSWKKMALIMIDGDICEYYAWFIKKRYNIKLNRPLRGAHISFINDSMYDIKKGLMTENSTPCELKWKQLVKKWDGKEIDIVLDTDVRLNDKHIWMVIPEKERKLLYSIRAEIGLSRPFYGLHMSVGTVNPKHIEHLKYIHRGIKLEYIQ